MRPLLPEHFIYAVLFAGFLGGLVTFLWILILDRMGKW
jgi:hypothetical protein